MAGDDAAECEFVDPREAVSRKLTPGLTDVFVDAGLIERDDLSGRDQHAPPTLGGEERPPATRGERIPGAVTKL